MNNYAVQKDKLAKTAEQYLALVKSDADWIVRSAADLEAVRRLDSPLAKLPDVDFNAFRDSLEFKLKGVAHGIYRPLVATLTISEIFQVFERFGMDREYTLRTLEYECAGSGCTFSFWNFCSSVCHAAKE